MHFDKIIEPALNSLVTAALDRSTVLYLMNTTLILGYPDSISKLRSPSLRHERHWLLADDVLEEQRIGRDLHLLTVFCESDFLSVAAVATEVQTVSSMCVYRADGVVSNMWYRLGS